MNKGKIKNIVFDLGNTLLYYDFEYFYDGLSRLEKKLNISRLKSFIRDQKLDIRLSTSKITHYQFFKVIKKNFHLRIGFNDFIFLYCDIFWENRQMLKFMENIYRNNSYRLFLLSNTDSRHMLFINRNFPVINLIKKKILSYKVKILKPSKIIFRHLLKKYKLKPEETIFIDDMKENIVSADAVGLNVIHYKNHKNFIKQFNIYTK